MMRSSKPRTHVSAATAAIALVLVACRSSAPAPESGAVEAANETTPETIVLATVNQEPLTLRTAMDVFMSSHGGGHGVLVQGEPAVRELAGRLVERELFYDEAVSLGIPDDEQIVEATEDYKYGTAEIVFWRREIEEKLHVADEDVEAFYAKTDVALALSIVEAATREEAEALRARVEAGEDLAELASAESIHPSRSFGGQLAYVRRGELEGSLEEVAFVLLEPGSLTPVVQTEDGWAFMRLEERTENPERPPRDLMIPRIRNILKDRQEDELRAEVEERVRSLGGVEVDDGLLTKENLLGDVTGEAVVATAAGENLQLKTLREGLNLDAVAAASSEQIDGILIEMAEDWAMKLAVRRAAREAGLLEDPEVVEKAETYKRDAVVQVLYSDYVYADLEFTEEELEEYYEANKETEFTRPEEIRLAYLVTATAEEAAALRGRVDAGESIEVLANELSIDPASAMTEGRAQWLRPGQILQEVEERAFALEEREIDGPIETEVGFFVIQVFERKEPQLIPYENARRAVVKRVARELQQEAHRSWARRLRDRADIEIHAEGIDQAVVWLDREAAEREAAEEASESDPVGPPVGPHAGGMTGHGAGEEEGT